MARRLVKNIKTGDGPTAVISVRPHGAKVRVHDVASGQIVMLSPDVARQLSSALMFAAKHAEISKPLAYQLYEKQLETVNAKLPD